MVVENFLAIKPVAMDPAGSPAKDPERRSATDRQNRDRGIMQQTFRIGSD